MNLRLVPGLSGYRAFHLRSVESTNDVAFAHAAAGDNGNLWIVAQRQTRGRGRRGRPWVSEYGNMYTSLLLPKDHGIAAASLAQLPLVTALAAHDAIAAILGPASAIDLAIKWPNDILGNNQKIAGILAESRSERNLMTIVLGIGVNCSHHPQEARYPATNLSALGHPIDPAELFPVLAKAVDDRLAEWDRGAGFSPIKAAWLERAAGLEGTMSVRVKDQRLSGKFVGLDDEGALLFHANGETHHISAGEVFFDSQSR